MEKYTRALSDGAEKFVEFLPKMIKQHMSVLAQQRLTTSKDDFLGSITMKGDRDILIIALDPDNWLANATESGADPFDIKEGFFKSKKVKVSKSGHRYLVIPITQSKGAKGSNTDKGQLFQSMIKKTLTRPKYKSAKHRLNIDGTLDVLQEVITEEKAMQGMYRVQTFSSASAKEKGAKPLNSKHVMFRVASERFPDKWLHPGIQGAEIFKNTEIWINGIIEATFIEFIENEIQNIS